MTIITVDTDSMAKECSTCTVHVLGSLNIRRDAILHSAQTTSTWNLYIFVSKWYLRFKALEWRQNCYGCRLPSGDVFTSSLEILKINKIIQILGFCNCCTWKLKIISYIFVYSNWLFGLFTRNIWKIKYKRFKFEKIVSFPMY